MKLATALTHIVVALGTIWSSAAMASEPCATFSAPLDELTVSYDPFSGTAVNRQFNLTVTRRSNEVASVRAFLRDPDDSTTFVLGEAGPAGYDITGSGSNANGAVFGGSSASLPSDGGLRYSFSSGRNQETSALTLFIPAQRESGTGNQRQQIEIVYACYDSGGRLIKSDVQRGDSVRIDLNVQRVFSAFTSSEGNGQINFGSVDVTSSTSTAEPAVVTVLSTQSYDMSIVSERGFVLRQLHNGPGLPYSATIDDLQITPRFNMSCPLTVPAGRGHRVKVTLDTREASKLLAGDYSDTLVVTILTREGTRGSGNCRTGAE